MTENLTHILIFKTNIGTELDKIRVGRLFSEHPAVEDWHVDMEDIDRVLRIVSYELSAEEIIRQITAMGYQCCELE